MVMLLLRGMEAWTGAIAVGRALALDWAIKQRIVIKIGLMKCLLTECDNMA